MKYWHIDFHVDFDEWALPLYFQRFGNWALDLDILCFHFGFRYYSDDDLTPEEELAQLDQYTKDQLEFIAEERERIHKDMGIQTR